MEFALYLLLGGFAGVLAGLFGVGGGLIIVPVLVFRYRGSIPVRLNYTGKFGVGAGPDFSGRFWCYVWSYSADNFGSGAVASLA